MANAIVKATPAPASFTSEELAVIDKQFFPPRVKPEEREYCLRVSELLQLSPFKREIMFVPRRQNVGGQWVEKIEPLVGRDGYLAIAHKQPTFDGMETYAEIRQVPALKGKEWTTVTTLVATCKVYRKDFTRPFAAEVTYDEYVQRNKDGHPTQFWATKPETMLKKVAESQALRKAFNVSGVYSPEELGVGSIEDGVLIREDDIRPIPEEPAKAKTNPPPAPPAAKPAEAKPAAAPPKKEEPVVEAVVVEEPPLVDVQTGEVLVAGGPVADVDGLIKQLKSRSIQGVIRDNVIVVTLKFGADDQREFVKKMGFKWNSTDKTWTKHL